MIVGKSPGKRRLCEERIINFASIAAQEAVREALLWGRKAQQSYKNNDGNKVQFRFIGVMELICLEPACEVDEVWYEMYERICPSERKKRILPHKSKLHAIRNHE